MALDLTTSYFSIEKADRNADGTLTVYGKATDDSLDIDQQICDAEWLDRAMPEWFKSGGNIREQHSQIAAGVAKEYEPKADGHYISALVVDPNSVKKVETGVLKGFSIGIKRPRVVRDTKAANGRIVDGQIVEVSLVDRPANPNAKLMLAKSVDGESSLVQVEELTEEIVKHPGHGDQSVHAGSRGHGGAGGAGGGAGSAEGGAGSSGVKETHAKQIEGHEADARGLSDSVTDIARGDSMVRPAAQSMRAAAGRLQDATSAKTKEEAVSSLKKAKLHVDNAVKNLEDQNYHMEASDAYSLSKRITSTIGAIGSSKAVDADIEKHPGHGDQSVHAGSRGRGGAGGAGGGAGSGEGSSGGGGGGGSASGGGAGSNAEATAQANRDNDKVEDMSEETSVLKAKMNEHIEDLEGQYGDEHPDIKRVERAVDSLQAAEQNFNRAATAKTGSDHQVKVEQAAGHLEDARNLIRQSTKETSDALLQSVTNLRNSADDYASALTGDKSSSADLRKELQTALQLFATKSGEAAMGSQTVKLPVDVVGELLKFDKTQYEAARDALANLISIEAQESKEGHNEIQSIAHLLEAVSHLHAWYEGEEAEGEVVEEEEIISEPIADKAPKKDADAEADAEAEADDEEDKDAEADAKKCPDCGMKMKLCKCSMGMKEADADADADICPTCKKSKKECACKSDAATDMTPTAQTGATLEGTTIVPPAETPKSVSVDPSTDLEAIVEEVVEKATTTLKAKIADLMSAKEAAEKKAVDLEVELATAKSLAVAGGPKRTAKPIDMATSDLLTKAAVYKAKAQAATDPKLALGFKQLAEEYSAKAAEGLGN